MKTILLENLEKSKKYSLQTAEAMPEDKYDFKPTNEVWSFKELMNHIAYCIQWMDLNYLKSVEVGWEPPALKNKKSDIIQLLVNAYADVETTVSGFDNLSEAQINGVFAILDHSTHHRGQAIMYLRCNQVVPPEYIF